jgi:hypothetical protein
MLKYPVAYITFVADEHAILILRRAASNPAIRLIHPVLVANARPHTVGGAFAGLLIPSWRYPVPFDGLLITKSSPKARVGIHSKISLKCVIRNFRRCCRSFT